MTSLSPGFRRFAAVGLLALVLGVLWLYAVLPIVTHLEDTDRSIAESQVLLQRAKQVAARLPALEARREALVRRLEQGSGFLKGASEEVVAAGLQEQIKVLIGRHGGTLRSTQALAAEDESGFRKVALRVSMSADTEGLQKVFHGLESASPSLFLDNIDIRAKTRSSRRPAGREEDSLQVRFDVFGYLQGTGS